MLTTVQCALHIAISIGTCISIVGRSALNHVSSALLVLVIRSIMGASTILFPLAKTINRLGAALGGALLVRVLVWASITIVGSVGGDLVGSAPLVNVILGVMEASAIHAPVSNTINRLRATLSDTLHLAILVWALLSTQVRLCGDLIGSAPLVVVSTSNMAASAIQAPLALTIHRLTATRLGAVLQLVLVWASIAIVQSRLAHFIQTAALILMVSLTVSTSIILTPSTDAIDGLETLRCGA